MFSALVTLFFIVNVSGFAVNRDEWDLTRTIHDLYPPPQLKEELAPVRTTKPQETKISDRDVIVFPTDDEVSPKLSSNTKPSEMRSLSNNNTDLEKNVSDFFKQILSNSTYMLSSAPVNKNVTGSNPNDTKVYLDPKDLESIFKSIPEVQEYISNSTNGNVTKFDTDIRFLTDSILKGAFHNSVEDKGVKLRTMIIPPAQSSIPADTGRSLIVPFEHQKHERPTNGCEKLITHSSYTLLFVFVRLFS